MAKKIDPEIVAASRAAAKKYRVPLPNIIGIVLQESAGRFFYQIHGRREPTVRHEGHYLFKRLAGSQRKLAVKMGLAAAGAGVIKNPSSQVARWDRLVTPSMKIDEDAEIESVSWGGPQVMGAHWKRLNFTSPQ